MVSLRTGQVNQLEGLLGEFGIVIPKGSSALNKQIRLILEGVENGLTMTLRSLVSQLKELIDELDIQIKELIKQVDSCHQLNEDSQRIAQIPGIGPMTPTSLVASIGDSKSFNKGRQVSAWIGLVSKQFSTGGK
ncbi:transposase [Vibrio mediterranei]|uniref:transposase n=1 Tax=Vibrio mediterranei TaxID=689 RepID=UPI00148D6084|nr:transposase [Vibrio mediterranei]NOH31412.1 IS110 family transposase [Vibrio mediterranei]